MQIDKCWSLDLIRSTQEGIGKELLPFLENDMFVQGIEHCLSKILPLENNHNNDLTLVCYIISTLNLISFSRETNAEYKVLVVKLEKIAKALLDKNNIKAGKSKLSFLHGQIKQSMSAILKNDGDTWGALWESSLGLFLSRGSTNPVLPFQHVSFALQTIDRGFPMRIMDILDEMSETLHSSYDQKYLSLLRIKALRLSGQHKKSERIIDSLAGQSEEVDRLAWEKHFSRAIQFGETRELHRFLFGKSSSKLDYSEAYIKYAFWMKAQPKRVYSKLCPKAASIKRMVKGATSNPKFKKLFKILLAIEEAYDVNIPIITRVIKIGKVMPIIETLEAEYRVLALASIVRFLNQRQKQMASIFHGEYQSQSLKMSEGKNNDIFNLFSDAQELDTIKPFYDSLHKALEKNDNNNLLNPIDKALFRSTWQDLKRSTLAS